MQVYKGQNCDLRFSPVMTNLASFGAILALMLVSIMVTSPVRAPSANLISAMTSLQMSATKAISPVGCRAKLTKRFSLGFTLRTTNPGVSLILASMFKGWLTTTNEELFNRTRVAGVSKVTSKTRPAASFPKKLIIRKIQIWWVSDSKIGARANNPKLADGTP